MNKQIRATRVYTSTFTGFFFGCVILASGAVSFASEVWDPPAVTVFPDHNEVAKNPQRLREILLQGEQLFEARFNLLDGAGRPASTGDSKPTIRLPQNQPQFIRTSGPDANSCAGCHNQPFVGGSGDFAVNVFVGAHFKNPPTFEIKSSVTNERNTIGMWGAGAIEMVAREMTADLLQQQSDALGRARRNKKPVRVKLTTKGVSFGSIVAKPNGVVDTKKLEGVDADLVIKPFGVKGIAISLREFTIGALNQHHGMQAYERFGWEKTGRKDFDEDGVEVEATVGQVSALALYQAALPSPNRTWPESKKGIEHIRNGEQMFAKVGCTNCHKTRLPLNSTIFSEPNRYNRPGTLVPNDVLGTIDLPIEVASSWEEGAVYRDKDGQVYVAAFTDLRRHKICDETEPFFCNEKLKQDFVPTDEFMTSKLWDLGSSSPYGHRGNCSTISEAIVHHAGEATQEKNAFLKLTDGEKRNIITYLLSLKATRKFEVLTKGLPKTTRARLKVQ